MLNTSKPDNRQHIQNGCLVPHITQITEAVYTNNRIASTSGIVMHAETCLYQGGIFNRHAANDSLVVKLPSFLNVALFPLESDDDYTFKVDNSDLPESYDDFAEALLINKTISVNGEDITAESILERFDTKDFSKIYLSGNNSEIEKGEIDDLMDEMTLEECINLVFGPPMNDDKIEVMEELLGGYIEAQLLEI